ncbi:MAG: hypothetical protein AAF368_10970 [Planctomycetota bacterium]
MTVVLPKDLRSEEICFKRSREWFRERGIPWSDVRNGLVTADFLEATGDENAIRAAKAARAREALERG